MLTWLVGQIKRRKVDKPLTKDREDDLRQAGATDLMIETIKANSPVLTVPTPTPTPAPVDLGDLNTRATNLVRPEYTEEARLARTAGEVKLALELDENGRVTSVARLTTLPNGLGENAIEAARRSTFRPALRDGKPARGSGILKYNFKVNVVDVAATLAAAHNLREKRDFDNAILEYTRVLDAEAKHPRAFQGRGMCHLAKANYALAVADLQTAANLDPQNWDVLVLLAIAQDFRGETRLAADNYGKALALRPELDSQAVFDCLYIDRRQMTQEQARSAAGAIINSCNQAFRAASDHLSGILYYKRGIAYRLRGEYDKAITEFESVLRANPQFTAVNTQLQIAYNSRGLEAFQKKDYKRAFDDVSLAIQADPRNATPYINRCAIYLYAWKQYAEAINDCSEAIKLANPQIEMVEYDATGTRVLRVFNPNIAVNPHALRVDRHGNIWVSDAYWNVVWKLSPKGDVLMMLGRRGESGAWNDAAWNGMFNQPLDIAFDQDDNFYVVQGHGGTSPPEDCSFCTTYRYSAGPNRRAVAANPPVVQGSDPRIMKFDKTGRFITSASLAHPTGPFATTHTVVISPTGDLWIGDRNAKKLIVLDRNLKRLREIEVGYLTCGLFVDSQGGLWMSAGMDGMVFKLDWNGKILGWFRQMGHYSRFERLRRSPSARGVERSEDDLRCRQRQRARREDGTRLVAIARFHTRNTPFAFSYSNWRSICRLGARRRMALMI